MNLGVCAAEGASAATPDKPVSPKTCAQGPTLGWSVAPSDPRFSSVSFRCLRLRRLPSRTPRAQRGLSLLELLVAFAILGISLGLLYRSMGTSARNVVDMGHQQQAAMLAESLLLARDSVAAEGWNESGAFAGFSWQVRSAPYMHGLRQGLPSPVVAQPEALALHQVRMTVRWEDGSRPRVLEIETLLPQRRPEPGEVLP